MEISTKDPFQKQTMANDIALLKTEDEIVFGMTTTFISLDFNYINTAETVQLYGWGRTYSTDNLQNFLIQGVFKVMPLQECRNMYPAVMRRFVLDSHLCSQWDNRATCPGKSKNESFNLNLIKKFQATSGDQLYSKTKQSQLFRGWNLV